ncbi:hypothetical protein B0H10DRAFT_1639637, partial [Mycena sp. CBHHK59/15]
PRPWLMHTSILSGHGWLDEVLAGNPDCCQHELGIMVITLTSMLKLAAMGDLMDGRYVTVQEQLALFVYWMVHGSSQRTLQE